MYFWFVFCSIRWLFCCILLLFIIMLGFFHNPGKLEKFNNYFSTNPLVLFFVNFWVIIVFIWMCFFIYFNLHLSFDTQLVNQLLIRYLLKVWSLLLFRVTFDYFSFDFMHADHLDDHLLLLFWVNILKLRHIGQKRKSFLSIVLIYVFLLIVRIIILPIYLS
jgi:hypothetical protein